MMHTYHAAEIVLPVLGYAAGGMFALAVLYMSALGAQMAYDQIKESGLRLSHISAAGMLVAGYVISKFSQKKPAHGRHAAAPADGVVSYWDNWIVEWEARPYSLMRSNSVFAA